MPARDFPLYTTASEAGNAQVSFYIPLESEILDRLSDLNKNVDELQKAATEKLNGVLSKLSDLNLSLENLFELTKLIDDTLFAIARLEEAIEAYQDYATQFGRFCSIPPSFLNKLPTILNWIAKTIARLKAIKFKFVSTYANNHASRIDLDVDNPVDWDEDPTVYQATTIAHGHMLCYKQKWKSAGFSFGDCIKAMALAPGQKKQIAVLEWDRSEASARSESTIASERLDATYSRERDIDEAIRSTLSESISGKSVGVAFGYGSGGGAAGAYGPLAFSGGTSLSLGVGASKASQSGSRSIAATTTNKMRDRINQASSAIRSQRSTVIQTVSQKESVTATTEVISNKNCCHSLNLLFMSLLKHYTVEQELFHVQECLFVPLKITPFDPKKVIRWAEFLSNILPTEELRLGVQAIQDLENDVDVPLGTLADEQLTNLWGNLRFSFDFPLPSSADPEEGVSVDSWEKTPEWATYANLKNARGLAGLFHDGFFQSYFYKRSLEQRHKNWDEYFVPEIVRRYLENIQIWAHTVNGGSPILLPLEPTQLTRYSKGVSVDVSLRLSDVNIPVSRSQIRSLEVKCVGFKVPNNANIILQNGNIAYQTPNMSGTLFANSRIENDIKNSDSAIIVTPLTSYEQTKPANVRVKRANALLQFLNANLEEVHHWIWRSGIDERRRYMMLDGIKLTSAGGRSVASLVENEIKDIIGNCLVMPVGAGNRIDPVFRENDVEDLYDFYKPEKKPEPFQVSFPQAGYFMEAVMGSCNSCEELDYTKAIYNGFNCADEPTAIEPVSLASRRADPGDLQAKDLPANIVNFQNNPAAPDPTGLASAFALLGKGDSFNDLTGLEQNQLNAFAALAKNADNAKAFADMAKQIFMGQASKMDNQTVDPDLNRINREKDKGNITPEEANALTKDRLQNRNDLASGKNNHLATTNGLLATPEVLDRIADGSDLNYSNSDESLNLSSNDTGTKYYATPGLVMPTRSEYELDLLASSGGGGGIPPIAKSDLTDFLDTDAQKTYKICIFVDQPGHGGDEDIFSIDGGSGHSFVRFEKITATTGSSKLYCGFYPKESTYDPRPLDVTSELRNDETHNWEVAREYSVNMNQFNNAIDYIVQSAFPKKYNLWHYNCTDFAIQVLGAAQISIPDRTGIVYSYLPPLPVKAILFKGSNPGLLGQDLRKLNGNMQTNF